MWLLQGDSGNLIYLKPNETLTVGRNRGDIVLPNDGSISRVHAKITVKPVENIGEIQEKTVPLSKVTIEDANSKYGNFILKENGEEIQITKDGYSLRHMDRIRFGLQNYIFTALYVPIITATSGMDETEKEQLKEIIDAIDGKIIYVWTPMCTHMTIEKPTISEKFSCALASCTPIVTMDYWKDVLRAFDNNEAFPEPDNYVDAINNKMKNVGKVCVKPNPIRKTCFRNLTFVHFNSKQYALYKRMIKLAGGTSIKYGKEKIDLNVSADNVIVVQMVESNTTQATGTGDANYAAACDQLSRCKRRAIPECEIALAILKCSTEKYCNPMYDYAELFKNRNSQFPDDNTAILALDTQDVDVPTTSGIHQQKKQNHIVTETVEESKEFEFQAPRSLRQCPADSMSESAASSSYGSESVGSMKLASLNHEKYLEEELNKRSTMSSDRQREPQNHIIKETVEESNQSDSQESKNIRGDPSDFTSESVASSSYNSNSIGSMKLASLNHEKYLQKEFTEQSAITGNPMKRERVEDVAIDATAAMKKIRLGTDEDCHRKRSLWEKLECSYAHSPTNDDDISEEKIVVNALPETKEIEQKMDMGNNSSISAKGDIDEDFDIADKWAAPTPKNKVPNELVGVSESKEKTSSAGDDDSTSRKRKVGRSDASPSQDVPENPRKRTKSSMSSDKDISESTKKTVFAAPTRSSKVESDEGGWNRTKDYIKVDDDLDSTFGSRKKYNAEVSVFFQRPDDPNTSTQRLLRITDDAVGTELGKCFRKVHNVCLIIGAIAYKIYRHRNNTHRSSCCSAIQRFLAESRYTMRQPTLPGRAE